MSASRWTVLVSVVFAVCAFFYFDLNQLLTMEHIKREQAGLEQLLVDRPLEFVASFFIIYVVVTALSLPGAATLLTLVAGALFGLAWGTVFVSFASSIGATLAMVIARWLFQDQSNYLIKLDGQPEGNMIQKDQLF